MTRRAFFAIVQARLSAQRRPIVYACAAALIVGFVQPRENAGPIFFCSLLGIVFALIQSPGRYPHLDLCEQSAPLFGRELARARALVPCITATLFTAVYCAAQLSKGFTGVPFVFVAALGGVIASTLTALSATIRVGPTRTLYVLFACTVSAIAYALAVATGSIPAELAFCAIVSFFAVRQYGEALARYDPV